MSSHVVLLAWLLAASSLVLASGIGGGYTYVQQSLTVIFGEEEERTAVGQQQQQRGIDEQLYSRQLYVYGRHAQQRLLEGHAIVCYKGGSEQVAAEIVKNLALAGIGRLSVYCASGGGGGSLLESPRLTAHTDLAEYAHELNPLVVAQTISSREDLMSMLSLEEEEEMKRGGGGETVLVAADLPLTEMVALNNAVRETNFGSTALRFVGVKVASLCGLLFNDFSSVFEVVDADGGDAPDAGKDIPLKSVSSTPSTELGVQITCIDEETLNVGLGDVLEISVQVGGGGGGGGGGAVAAASKLLSVHGVVNTKSLVLQADSPVDVEFMVRASRQGLGMSVKRTKRGATVSHEALERQLIRPAFAPCNGCLAEKKDRAQSLVLLAAFRALEGHAAPHATLSSFKSSLIATLISMGILDPLKPLKEKGGVVGEETIDRIAQRFFRGSSSFLKCPATVSVMGSLASQEAIKAVTHIYTPVSQFLMFESLDSLHPHTTDEKSLLPYGAEICQELAKMKIFIVGSGAIGCELLKNFAMMMVVGESGMKEGQGKVKAKKEPFRSRKRPQQQQRRRGFPARGGIVLTDMDHIEKSNLNRQLLFREKHVGQPKSLVASEMIRLVNPFMRIRALTDRVGGGGNSSFSPEFWQEADVVVTALDNVDARKFVDEQCVRFGKHLLDSGTLGTKGNTQAVLPFVTESYASSADPPEEAIPLCTLKSFPYQPDHCVSWARSIFDQYFLSDVRSLKTFVGQLGGGGGAGDVLSALQELSAEDLARLARAIELAPRPDDGLGDVALRALQWSLGVFHELFVVNMAQLVKEHPLDSKDDEGAPFWGGSRRFPTLLPQGGFNASDPIHTDFVRWGAWLFAKAMGHDTVSEAKVRAFCSDQVLSRAFAASASVVHPRSPETVLKTLLAPTLSFFQSWQPEEFEKDDLSLGHVAFVTSAANLRCILYGLRGVDQLEVQKVAGKIVPALATTTALVSGLVSLELLKIASERLLGVGGRERVLSRFRNSFVNLARPLLAFAQPVEAEAFGEKTKFTMWDVLDMPRSSVDDLTVSAMAAHLSTEFGVQLQSVSLGDTLLYASFLPGSDERLDTPLRALRGGGAEGEEEDAAEDKDEAFWDLELVCVSEETGEDVRLPPMRISTSKVGVGVGVEGEEEKQEELGKVKVKEDIFAVAGRVVSKAKARAQELSAKLRRKSTTKEKEGEGEGGGEEEGKETTAS